MRRSRFLIATGYLLALLLLLLPLLEPVVALLPLQPSQIRWRLQAFGALSQALVLPQLGGVIALGTAVLLGQRRVVRVLAIAALALAALLVVASVLFVLDLLQYRDAVGTGLREYYETAGVIYLSAYVLSAGFLLWVGAVAWRVARRPHHRRAGGGHGPGASTHQPL